jgi:hypothetical protein
MGDRWSDLASQSSNVSGPGHWRHLSPSAPPEWQDPGMDLPLDTSADAHRAQIEAYRRMGGPGRAALVFRLNDLARAAAIAGIQARHPDYDDERRRLAYARLVLGDDLTRKVWPQHDLVEP